MEFSNSVLGGGHSKLINIRRFKEENAVTPLQQNVKLSRINDRVVLGKIQSINPSIDTSNLLKEMKECESELQKYDFHDLFNSPETLNARGLIPIYPAVDGDLKMLRVGKSDLYQTKKTKLYTPFPSFTPRGYITPGQTLLITISLYYPFHWQKNQLPDEAVLPHFKEAIQFYDTQTLNDLKQAFKCENVDSEISGDISEHPHKPLEFIINNDLKYALFYINNKIYVDSLQDGKTLTYAKTMKSWAQKNGHSVEGISTMDEQLLDLEIRIGEPYVYQHLGRCEHLIVFDEISFALPTDCLGQSNYPRIISMAKEKLKHCIFCSKNIASIVMICDDNRTPVTVNHICDSCFISYNYDHVGDKLANFTAYRTLKWKK